MGRAVKISSMSLADIRAYKQIGDRRFREVHGLYYEDVVVGEIVEHRPGRTVTETDNLWGSLLALNPNPLHIDAAYAATTEWGRPLVSSLVTLSIVTGMSVNSTSFRTIANLGWDEVCGLWVSVAPFSLGDGRRRRASDRVKLEIGRGPPAGDGRNSIVYAKAAALIYCPGQRPVSGSV